MLDQSDNQAVRLTLLKAIGEGLSGEHEFDLLGEGPLAKLKTKFRQMMPDRVLLDVMVERRRSRRRPKRGLIRITITEIY